MKLIKKFFSIGLVVVACFSLTVILKNKVVKNTGLSPSAVTVVIDAGHGGIDGGATGVLTGVRESDLNLIIAKKLQEKFAVLGIKTVMTRQDNNGLYDTTEPGFKKRDLNKRLEIINSSGAVVLISIHLNTYTSKLRRGAQVFYKKGNENGKKLATFIQNGLNVVKDMPRLLNALSGDYYLLNETKIASVIVECGFLSNPDDERLLLLEEYRNNVANAICNGTLKYLTLK